MIYKNIIKKKIKEKIEIINHNLFKIFSNKTNAILLYHRVLPQIPNFTLGNEICVEEFESQIKYLKLNYDIVPLNFESSNKRNKTISLSFDDGYKDNYLYAFPILKKLSISASFFILPYYVNNRKIIWDLDILNIINFSNLENKKLVITYKKQKIFFKKNYEYVNDKIKIFNLINYLKKLNINQIEEIITELKKQINYVNIKNIEDECMTWNNLEKIEKSGMLIGSHGSHHLSYKHMSNEEIEKDLLMSKSEIENNLNIQCDMFAFPFGSRDDFDIEKINFIKSQNFKKILLNIHGNNYNDQNICKRKIIYEGKKIQYIYG